MKKNIYFIYVIMLICFLTTCKHSKIVSKTATQENLEQFYWQGIVKSSNNNPTLLHSFIDSVLTWNYVDTIHQEGRIYPYHFYGDFMGGNLASKTPSDFAHFGKLSSLFMLPYIERSPKLIKTVYDENKKFFFMVVDSTKAYKLGLDILADDLLFTFDTLFSKRKPMEVFRKYKNVYNTKTDIMAIIRGGPARMGKKIIYKPLSNYYEWIYTFWYRRHLENNIEVCVEILKEIQKKYPSRKKYTWRKNWYTVTKRNKENYLSKLTTIEQKEIVKIMKNVGLFSETSL